MKEKELEIPKPKHKYGYTNTEINEIIKDLNIDEDKFFNTLGVNTCMRDRNGNCITYTCDVVHAIKCSLGLKVASAADFD